MRPPGPTAQAWEGTVCDCWPSYNRRGLSTAQTSASEPLPGLSRFRGGAAAGPGLAAGLSHPHHLGCVPDPVSGPLCASGSARPHPVGPHLSQRTVHTTPALHLAAGLSFPPKAFTSTKRLRRLAKVSQLCACTSAAYVLGRAPRDWPAPCGPVRLGVVHCRKARSALGQRGMRDRSRGMKVSGVAM